MSSGKRRSKQIRLPSALIQWVRMSSSNSSSSRILYGHGEVDHTLMARLCFFASDCSPSTKGDLDTGWAGERDSCGEETM